MIYNYKFFQKAYYHPKGSHFNRENEIDSFEYSGTLVPVFNLIMFILFLFDTWKHDKYSNKRKWFKPRKPFN
jgi:hypothetical protein